MDEQDLSLPELQCLQYCALGRRDPGAALDTLARLERMNLLMRGGGRSYVVTERGQKLLHRAAPAPPLGR